VIWNNRRSVVVRDAFRTAMARTSALLCLVLPCAFSACDNVGRAFNPGFVPGGPSGGNNSGPSPVQVVPVGGDARNARPQVRNAAPKATGWPVTVPIVVEFSESVNEAFLKPTSQNAGDGRLFVRAKGTVTPLPAQYDFFAGGKLVILRPTALPQGGSREFEVVLKSDARDADGVQFQGAAEQILADFVTDAPTTEVNGKVVATFPRANALDATRETEVFVVFSRPANGSSITSSSLSVRVAGGADATGDLDLPLTLAGLTDPRCARFKTQPGSPLAGGQQYEIVVDATITFPSGGVLDFGHHTPFSRFTTVAPLAPTAVAVGNPVAGFPDKINRSNIQNLVLHVDVPAETAAGDAVVARVYGLDRNTVATNDLAFVERSAAAPVAGAQTVTIDFGGAIGSADSPRFSDGALTMAAQIQRGDGHSGFIHGASTNGPRFDTTAPSLTRIAPAGATAFDAVTDQEQIALYGVASEELGAATLTVGSTTADLFACSTDGRFAMQPLLLGRLQAAVPYTLSVTDKAGNMAVAAINGSISQRGVLTGVQAGTLMVEAYDVATLLPVANATVLVDPGVPTVPATGQVTALTGPDGRAMFTGLSTPTVTVTVVRAGYHLVSLYDSAVAFASLPLRPLTGATATVQGDLVVQQAANATALIGNNTYDDELLLAVPTTPTASTSIPPTAIVPNRPQVISGFYGVFEPTAVPTFATHGIQMCGPALIKASPPGAPTAAGQTDSETLTLIDLQGAAASLAATYAVDFAVATGLDTANLVGGKPLVRMTMSLYGFGGQTLAGVGFGSLNSGASFTVNATFSQIPAAVLAAYSPTYWVVTEARDLGGQVSRQRSLYVPSSSQRIDGPVPALPTITPPSGPFTTAPAVTFVDAIDRTAVPFGLGLGEVLAQDAAGRQWSVLFEDADGFGSDTVQYPDLATAGVTGLQLGTWSLRTTGRLFLSLTEVPGDIVLAEARRDEVTCARAAQVLFSVQ
jgi:hypothetical protein